VGKIKVVVDINVFISAILFGGTPGELIPLWKSGHIVPLISKPILDEYLNVLAYPKFELSEAEINYILYVETLPYVEVIVPASNGNIIKDDPTGDKFLHCAKAGNAHAIISGDHHLLNLGSYQNISIQTPADFLAGVTAGT
jgi:putative PIN family toxin of toxin-antitoxin system